MKSRSLFIAVGVGLLCCLGLLIYGSNRGFDLSDESFYLIWIRNPEAYQLTYQPFGYLLNPLFQLAGEHLQSFRLAGFAIVAFSGGFLGFSIANEPVSRRLFALYGALAGLTIFFPWIITPSYNSAANVAAFLILAGVLPLVRKEHGAAIATSITLGLGLLIAAFSKPPLLAIGLLSLVTAGFIVRRLRVSLMLLWAVVLAIALTLIILPPSDLLALLDRMISSQRILSLPNTPLGLPARVVCDGLDLPLVLQLAALAGLASHLWPRAVQTRFIAYTALALALGYTGAHTLKQLASGTLPALLGFGLVVTAIAYAAVLKTERRIDLLPIALLLVAPLCVALGTFNNHWAQFNLSLAFPFLAIFVLATGDLVQWRRVSALALAVLGPVAVMLLASLHPYGLSSSIFRQTVAIEHPVAGGLILVDRDTAAFVNTSRNAAAGAVMLDLSGYGPGVAATLGARPPVWPWLITLTPSWPDVVWARLTQKEREQAWFVGPVSPEFARSRPALWLRSHQSSFCRIDLVPLVIGGQQKPVAMWRPCRRPM